MLAYLLKHAAHISGELWCNAAIGQIGCAAGNEGCILGNKAIPEVEHIILNGKPVIQLHQILGCSALDSVGQGLVIPGEILKVAARLKKPRGWILSCTILLP